MLSSSLQPVCKVIDIPIFWSDAVGERAFTEAQIINMLNEFIPINPDVRIFNLSIGNNIPISSFYVTPLSNELDVLARKYDVVFVIAAGNLSHGIHADWTDYDNYFSNPTSRIGSPAEALLGITVGSIAEKNMGTDIAPVNSISPFSRVGPGLDEGIKPELVSLGGNSYVHAGSGLYNAPSAANGLDASGSAMAYNIGTSFAAPVVSHFAARILATDEQMTANLLKCHLVHFAKNSHLPSGIGNRAGNRYGFGEFDYKLYSSRNNNQMLFLYEGEIESENYVHIPFHIPSALDKQGRKRLRVKFTIVYNPPVDGSNPTEYSQSRISFSLFKIYGVESVEVAASTQESKYSVPWNPNIKYEREFSRNFSSGMWELRLRLYGRGNIPDDFKQNFAVIIECTDETNSIDFYQELLNEHGNKYVILTSNSGNAV